MRFIQRKEFLEVHNHKAVFPVSTTALGIGLLALGLIFLFKAGQFFQIAGITLCIFGSLVVLFTLYIIEKYKYYTITIDYEDLWERNFLGTHRVRLDHGKISSVEVDVFGENSKKPQYEVKLNYPSGKSYAIEVTDSQEHAKAVADIFSFYFTKKLIIKSPGEEDLELDTDRFKVSLYKRLQMQYPQGIPRREPPEIDYMEKKKIHSNWTLFFKYPPASLIYTVSLQFLLITILIFIAMAILHTGCILYGIMGLIAGVFAFFTVWSLEGDNSEEISISPDGFRYSLHHPAGDTKIEIPLKRIRLISIVSSTGYKIEKWNLFRKIPAFAVQPGQEDNGKELYVLTDQAIIGMESWLNEEMAEYIGYLAENSIYILTQKNEREDMKLK